MNNVKLGVNIDHVATIRNARGGIHPNPLQAALISQDAGADGITAHLREDRRHITDNDLKQIRESIHIPFNLEIAPTSEMLEIAINNQPSSVCIVPERRQEITTEGGLDVVKLQHKLKEIITELKHNNIKVSIFIEADLQQIELAKKLNADIVELHTGRYSHYTNNSDLQDRELSSIKNAAKFAHELGLVVHAGHGLTYFNVKNIANIPEVSELNIGHFIIGESIFCGLANAIKKMQQIIAES
ncbi:MAG: pyridoxine 5'-phosphate synthase [Pseudomonadota bacterium]